MAAARCSAALRPCRSCRSFPDAGPLQVVQLDDLVETVAVLLRPERRARVALERRRARAPDARRGRRAYRRWLGCAAGARHRLAALACARCATGSATSLACSAGGRRCAAPRGARSHAARSAIRPLERGDRHRAAIARRRARRRAGLRAGALVRAALSPQAAGVRHLRPLLDRHRPDLARARLRGSASALMREAGSARCAGRGRDRRRRWPTSPIGIGIAVPPHRPAGALSRRSRCRCLRARRHAAAAALWIDPLGPMLKICPIIVLNLVALAILDDR